MDLTIKLPQYIQQLVNTYYSVIMNLHQLDIHIDSKNVQKILSSYFLDYINCNTTSIKEINDVFSMEIKKHTGKSISINNLTKNEVSVKYNVVENDYTFIIGTNLQITTKVPIHILERLNALNSNKVPLLILVYRILGMEMGHFWGIHPNFYKIIEEEHSNSVECFASPFNCNLKQYYSVISIDKYFGSLGKFQENFIKDKNNVYVLNPPFTKYMIDLSFQLCKQKMEKKKCLCYFYLPYWKDLIDPYLEEMKEYEIKKCVLPAKKSFVYDYMSMQKIPNYSFDLIFFSISNDKKEKCIFEKLVNHLKI